MYNAFEIDKMLDNTTTNATNISRTKMQELDIDCTMSFFVISKCDEDVQVPHGCMIVPLNSNGYVPSYFARMSLVKPSFVNKFSKIISKVLPFSTKIKDTSELAIVTTIMNGKTSLGAPPTISFSFFLLFFILFCSLVLEFTILRRITGEFGVETLAPEYIKQCPTIYTPYISNTFNVAYHVSKLVSCTDVNCESAECMPKFLPANSYPYLKSAFG